MLGRALQQAAGLQLALRQARGIGGAPLVKDSLVAITAVTQDGRRFPVLGRAGTSLADALAACQWQPVVGRMATLSCSWGSEAHVRIAHEWLDKVPAPDTQGVYDLDLLADGVASDSRLASKARLWVLTARRLRAPTALCWPWRTADAQLRRRWCCLRR